MLDLTPETRVYFDSVTTGLNQGRSLAGAMKFAGDIPEMTLGQVICALDNLGDLLEDIKGDLATSGNPVQAYIALSKILDGWR